MDYNTLFLTIKSYVENDFPDTSWTDVDPNVQIAFSSKEQIDTFIKQAEQRIFNSVQLLDLRKTASVACTPASPIVAAPADWLANFSVAVVTPGGEYTFILNKDVNFIRAMYPSPAETGVPVYYALSGAGEFLVGPTPDIAYNLEVNYFYYPESIVVAGNSWLGDNFDSVLLYGALLEAYTFMKGEEDVTKNYQARYNEALAQLKQLGEGKNRQDQYRTPQVRYPVG